jgi:hypothetical protein
MTKFKKEILVKSVLVVIALIVLISLVGGWGAIFSAFGEFIKFIIFLGLTALIGYCIVKWWGDWGKKS